MRKLGALPFAALLVICFNVSSLWGVSILNFPRISFDTETLTGIAFVNPTRATARVEISAYGVDGQLLHGNTFENPAVIELFAGEQHARLLSELFKGTLPPGATGWMQAVSETDGITGFFLFLDTGITRFDGAGLPGLGRKVIFNDVRQDAEAMTELNLFNPWTSETEVTLQLWRPDASPLSLPQPIVLAAHGMTRFEIPAVFGLGDVPAGSALVAIATAQIGGFEFVRYANGDLVGLNARPASETLSSLEFPQMAVLGPWQTNLGIVNYLDREIIVTIYARQGDGSLFSAPDLVGNNPTTRILGPGQTLFEDVEAMFGFNGGEARDGWIQVESTAPAVNGFVSYGLPSTGSRAAVSTQAAPRKRALFSHIATSLGYFTGLALLNPGSLTANFRVLAFTSDGEQLGSFEGILQPSQRISKLITELIPATDGLTAGYFVVLSEQALYMTSLFGTDSVLANIAPQSSPALDEPGFGGIRTQIAPPFAVVQPTGSFQFQTVGFAQPPSWSVADRSGSGPGLGSVSPSGLFLAPGQTPDTLPVSVIAERKNRIAAASVDVLSKSVLLGGEPQILSVSYLRSLQKLYLAELSSQGAAAAGAEPAQAGPASQVFQALPGPKIPVASFPGDEITKMISFRAANDREYLLIAVSPSGRVVRLDPGAGSTFDVVTGLDSPSALVLDPVSGNLLIAERDRILSIPRSQLEVGLQLQSQTVAASSREASATVWQIAGGLADTAGLAVDICTGKLYISETGGILELDRQTGTRISLEGPSDQPAQLLALYRVGLPCPDAFQLLVSYETDAVPTLLVPSQNLSTPWPGDPQTRDLAFLPEGNPFGDDSAVLLGDSGEDLTGRLSSVRVAGLYAETPANPANVPSLVNFSDLLGDTLNETGSELDVWGVTTFLQEETTTSVSSVQVFLQQDTTGNQPAIASGMQLTFTHPVTPAGSGLPNALFGRLDIDVDQDPVTGQTSSIDRLTHYSSNLGVDYYIDFGGYRPDDETVPLFQVQSSEAVEVARIRVAFEEEITSGTSSVQIDFRVTDIDADGFADLALLVSTADKPADVIPNGGHLTTGRESPQ